MSGQTHDCQQILIPCLDFGKGTNTINEHLTEWFLNGRDGFHRSHREFTIRLSDHLTSNASFAEFFNIFS